MRSGRRLVPQLVERGHEVTATTTNPAKTAALEGLGARAVVVDGLDSAAVGEAVATAEPDAVVHQMTALSRQARPEALRPVVRADQPAAHRGARPPDRRRAGLRRAARRRPELHRLAQHPVRRLGQGRGGPAGPGAAEGAAGDAGGDPLPRGGGAEGRRHGAAVRRLLRRRRRNPMRRDGAEAAVPAGRRRTGLHVLGAPRRRGERDGAGAGEGVGGVFNIVDDEPAPASEWLPYLAECVGAKPPLRLPGLGGPAGRRRGRRSRC